MQADVVKFVNGCVTCAGSIVGKASVTASWQLVSLDFIGPSPKSSQGYTHVLVVTDRFTKYVVLFPVRAGLAKSLSRCVEQGIFLVYGAPKYLVCDNGTQMKSREFQQLCKNYKVHISYTPLYCPRAPNE